MPDEAVSLREYVEAILRQRDTALNEYKAELSVRLDKLNQLRENVLTRAEYQSRHEALVERISRCETWQAAQTGKSSGIALDGECFLLL